MHRGVGRRFNSKTALSSHIIRLDEIGDRRVIIVGDGWIDSAAQFLPRLIPMSVVDFVGRQPGDQRQFTSTFFDLFTVSLAEAGVMIEDFANSVRGLIRELHMA